jgi:hypothetical protein
MYVESDLFGKRGVSMALFFEVYGGICLGANRMILATSKGRQISILPRLIV